MRPIPGLSKPVGKQTRRRRLFTNATIASRLVAGNVPLPSDPTQPDAGEVGVTRETNSRTLVNDSQHRSSPRNSPPPGDVYEYNCGLQECSGEYAVAARISEDAAEKLPRHPGYIHDNASHSARANGSTDLFGAVTTESRLQTTHGGPTAGEGPNPEFRGQDIQSTSAQDMSQFVEGHSAQDDVPVPPPDVTTVFMYDPLEGLEDPSKEIVTSQDVISPRQGVTEEGRPGDVLGRDIPIQSFREGNSLGESGSDHRNAERDSLQGEETNIPGRPELGQRGQQQPFTRALGIDHWQKLLPAVLIGGSVKLTRAQFSCMMGLCNFLNAKEQDSWRKRKPVSDSTQLAQKVETNVFPAFSTLQRNIMPLLKEKLIARSIDILHDIDPRKAGVSVRVIYMHNGCKTPVRVIPVSEYARMDVALGPVFKAMTSTSSASYQEAEMYVEEFRTAFKNAVTPGIKSWNCIDDWPIVADRLRFYGVPQCLGVTRNRSTGPHSVSRAEIGDLLLVTVFGRDSLPQDLRRSYPVNSEYSNSAQNNEFCGELSAIWTSSGRTIIRSPGGMRSSPLSAAERFIVSSLIVSPPLRSTMQGLCKVGDTFALLRPLGNNPRDTSRIVIVYRFFLQGDDRSCFFFWIRPAHDAVLGNGTDTILQNIRELKTSNSRTGRKVLQRTVSSVTVARCHGLARGAEAIRSVSSTGYLPDGRRYFIYRFMLFWDGFRLTEGKKASGEGVYMVSLNLPPHMRSSSSAVRVLCLTPPGVKFDVVFATLKEDILEGMTEGFLDYDPTGGKISIFLDYVGSVGDTLALNDATDVMGHTADTFCHLCRSVRKPNEDVTVCGENQICNDRYTDTDTHAGHEFATRSMHRHESLRQSNIDEETCKFLGLKPAGREGVCGLHDLSRSFKEIQDKIPRTSEGVPLIPGVLDPYKSLFIGPDHLLTGLAKDCINAALLLLPSPKHRSFYESFALAAIRDCRMPTQNRVVDRKSGTLFSMTLSELYTLLFISEYAFTQALDLYDHEQCRRTGVSPLTNSTAHRSRKCAEAIRIVGKCSRLVSRLWHWPRREIDGHEVFLDFNRNAGMNHVHRTREYIEEYISDVHKLCTFSSENIRKLAALHSRRDTSSRNKKLRLKREMAEASIARSQLDHPNVHRLLELGYVLLPMVGHVSRVSELVFEKTHQALKRSVSGSNHISPHLTSVTSCAINDWQGRLTMLLCDLRNKGECGRLETFLGIFRLLMGREEVALRSGKLRPEDIEIVRTALGPPGTVDRLLLSEGRSVLVDEMKVDEGGSSWIMEAVARHVSDCPYSYESPSQLHPPSMQGGSAANASPENSLIFPAPQPQRIAMVGHRRVLSHRDRGAEMLDSLVGMGNYRIGNKVRLVSLDGKRYPNSYDVYSGEVIQVLSVKGVAGSNTRWPVVITNVKGPSSDVHKEVSFWYVLSFFQSCNGTGAVVLECCRLPGEGNGVVQTRHGNENVQDTDIGEGRSSTAPHRDRNANIVLGTRSNLVRYKIAFARDRGPSILFLTESCRRVGVLHDCTGGCYPDEKGLLITHNTHILDSTFHLLHRANGYPPRRA